MTKSQGENRFQLNNNICKIRNLRSFRFITFPIRSSELNRRHNMLEEDSNQIPFIKEFLQ